MTLWVAEANKLRALLPPDVQARLLTHEAAGITSTQDYNNAVQVFYDRSLCRYDEATEAVVQPFADHIADVRWTIFEQSSHVPHIEETAGFLDLVAGFLAHCDE